MNPRSTAADERPLLASQGKALHALSCARMMLSCGPETGVFLTQLWALRRRWRAAQLSREQLAVQRLQRLIGGIAVRAA